MSRAFMIRGQHTGVHFWKVYPDPPTAAQLTEALNFEIEREGVQYVRDEKGAVIDAKKKPCWVQVQTCELVDGLPDDDTSYTPARLEGFIDDELFAKKVEEAKNPTTFQSRAAAPQMQASGTAETITSKDVGEISVSDLGK